MKRGEGTRAAGGWHVHVHGVVLSGGLDASALADDWCDLTGGSANPAAQDVRPIRSMTAYDCEDMTEAQIGGIGDDLVEVFKYPLKFSNLGPADRWEAFRVLRGRHLIRAMGALKGLKVDPSYLDEPLQVEDWPYVRLFFRHGAGGYQVDGRIFVDIGSSTCEDMHHAEGSNYDHDRGGYSSGG